MRLPRLVKYLPIAIILLAVLTLSGCGDKTVAAGGGAPGGGGPGKGGGGRRGEGGGPVPVLVTTVSQRDVPINVDVIGNVEAYSTITVKSLVGGQLIKVHFREGDFVKKDDILFNVDPRPFEGQLNQAQANLLRDTAALSQAEANLARDTANAKYAQTQAVRFEKLLAEGVFSREQTDQARASADALAQTVAADRAAIESAKAQIVSAKSSVENAKVQLSYTTIRSAIDGRTGNLMVKQGNIIAANSSDLMTITEVHPIYVTFSVPEALLGDIKKYMAHGKLTVIARPETDETVRQTGALTFIDNAVDPTTGTIKLKGTFTNTDNKLWPGEFVRVTLRLTTRANAVVVPNQAVQTGQDGQFVYVVNQDRTVAMRPVVTSTRVDQDLVIDRGLEPGETIVTEGQLRLAPGSRVQVQDGRGRGRGAADGSGPADGRGPGGGRGRGEGRGPGGGSPPAVTPPPNKSS